MQRRNTNTKINNVKDHIWIVWKGKMSKPKLIIMRALLVFIFQFHQSLMIKLKWHMWPSSAKIMLKLHFDIMTSSKLFFQLTTLENIFFKWKFIMQHLRFQSMKWDMSRKLVFSINNTWKYFLQMKIYYATFKVSKYEMGYE
jgi:hypothetical protein